MKTFCKLPYGTVPLDTIKCINFIKKYTIKKKETHAETDIVYFPQNFKIYYIKCW